MRRPVSPDSLDRRRTSLATTAKPRPLSPARAASMAALIDSRLVWRARLPTSSALSPRLPEAADKERTEPSTMSRDCTKPSRHCSRPSSLVSHCVSMAARVSMSMAWRGLPAGWASGGAMMWSSSARIAAKLDNRWPMASRIWARAVPTWLAHRREASSRRWAISSSSCGLAAGLRERPNQRCAETPTAAAATSASGRGYCAGAGV